MNNTISGRGMQRVCQGFAASILSLVCVLGAGALGIGSTAAHAVTNGQITDQLGLNANQTAFQVTVSGHGFGWGQSELVGIVDPSTNVLWGSTVVTASYPRFFRGIYFPGGTFVVQISLPQYGCPNEPQLNVTAYTPQQIANDRATDVANSNILTIPAHSMWIC